MTLHGSTRTNCGLNSTHFVLVLLNSAWNLFTLYMHISLGGLFIVGEKGGSSILAMGNYGRLCVIPFKNISSYKTMIRDSSVVVDFRALNTHFVLLL